MFYQNVLTTVSFQKMCQIGHNSKPWLKGAFLDTTSLQTLKLWPIHSSMYIIVVHIICIFSTVFNFSVHISSDRSSLCRHAPLELPGCRAGPFFAFSPRHTTVQRCRESPLFAQFRKFWLATEQSTELTPLTLVIVTVIVIRNNTHSLSERTHFPRRPCQLWKHWKVSQNMPNQTYQSQPPLIV